MTYPETREAAAKTYHHSLDYLDIDSMQDTIIEAFVAGAEWADNINQEERDEAAE